METALFDLAVLPSKLADRVYDFAAERNYRWFGR